MESAHLLILHNIIWLPCRPVHWLKTVEPNKLLRPPSRFRSAASQVSGSESAISKSAGSNACFSKSFYWSQVGTSERTIRTCDYPAVPERNMMGVFAVPVTHRKNEGPHIRRAEAVDEEAQRHDSCSSGRARGVTLRSPLHCRCHHRDDIRCGNRGAEVLSSVRVEHQKPVLIAEA